MSGILHAGFRVDLDRLQRHEANGRILNSNALENSIQEPHYAEWALGDPAGVNIMVYASGKVLFTKASSKDDLIKAGQIVLAALKQHRVWWYIHPSKVSTVSKKFPRVQASHCCIKDAQNQEILNGLAALQEAQEVYNCARQAGLQDDECCRGLDLVKELSRRIEELSNVHFYADTRAEVDVHNSDASWFRQLRELCRVALDAMDSIETQLFTACRRRFGTSDIHLLKDGMSQPRHRRDFERFNHFHHLTSEERRDLTPIEKGVQACRASHHRLSLARDKALSAQHVSEQYFPGTIK